MYKFLNSLLINTLAFYCITVFGQSNELPDIGDAAGNLLSIEEEKALGIYMAQSLSKATKLPAYQYLNAASRARPIKEIPGLWIRNLLANRIYQCPVIFLEPYVMNNKQVHERIQLGDYKETKMIQGEEKKSIYREYADAVVVALRQYYLDYRIIYNPEGS